MGHYCKICGRTRANEKFSGKGHKNQICKDCSRKPKQQGQSNSKEDDLILGAMTLPEDEDELEDIYFNNVWFPENELEEENTYIENDEEIPF
ncbi:MAG: hypothetical protein GX271_08865 [Clostridiales bacterium]|jgi:hypothetical protein|nr:hypothetical protein [Clostridiales bacterium]